MTASDNLSQAQFGATGHPLAGDAAAEAQGAANSTGNTHYIYKNQATGSYHASAGPKGMNGPYRPIEPAAGNAVLGSPPGSAAPTGAQPVGKPNVPAAGGLAPNWKALGTGEFDTGSNTENGRRAKNEMMLPKDA